MDGEVGYGMGEVYMSGTGRAGPGRSLKVSCGEGREARLGGD